MQLSNFALPETELEIRPIERTFLGSPIPNLYMIHHDTPLDLHVLTDSAMLANHRTFD